MPWLLRSISSKVGLTCSFTLRCLCVEACAFVISVNFSVPRCRYFLKSSKLWGLTTCPQFNISFMVYFQIFPIQNQNFGYVNGDKISWSSRTFCLIRMIKSRFVYFVVWGSLFELCRLPFCAGSCDAGRTVFASDPTMNALCKKACGDVLNLKWVPLYFCDVCLFVGCTCVCVWFCLLLFCVLYWNSFVFWTKNMLTVVLCVPSPKVPSHLLRGTCAEGRDGRCLYLRKSVVFFPGAKWLLSE